MTIRSGPRPETDDANEAAVKAARDAYRPAYEQGALSDIASCADWFGWHAAIKAAKPEIQRQALRDLQDRLDNADKALTDLERSTPGGAFERKVRLAGKAEGVRLALSYVDEALRVAQSAEEATPTQADPQVVAEPGSSSLGMSTWRITEWFREYRNSRPGGGTYGDAVTKLNRVTTTMYDDQTLAACWTLAAGEPPTRAPLTRADIPAGQGPASLYVDAESTAVMYRTAEGRSVPVPAMWVPTDSDGIDALNAALSALAATLPTVTAEEGP